MRRPDLPGFYFDAEKNRYFPISHQTRARPSQNNNEAISSSSQVGEQNKRRGHHQGGRTYTKKVESSTEDGVLSLLRDREISGNHRCSQYSGSAKAFQGKYLELQTAQPRVWRYSKKSNWADGGLKQLRITLQTIEGEEEADVMTLGGTNGQLGVWQITEKTDQDVVDLDGDPHLFSADRYPPERPYLWTGEEKGAPVLCSSMHPVVFPSRITSIKGLNDWPDNYSFQNGRRLQQSVILTTLGNGLNGGELYLLSPTEGQFSNPWHDYLCALPFRLSTNVSTGQSIWTCESNPRGKSASLGMSSGAGIVDLEKAQMSWLCRSSSDVLSQQFDSSGNVVLCGFRNGVISTIDLRLPQPQSQSRASHPTDYNARRRGLFSKWKESRQRCRDPRPYSSTKKTYEAPNQAGKGHWSLSSVDSFYCSHSKIMQMKSAICSLALLRSSEWYLLASAMNGDIQQWDRRYVERGALRCYEGHVNSHTHLQLGVDPTERLLVSGGEDYAVRVWSLDSGRLLHVESGLASPVTTVSWPTSFRITDSNRWGGFREEPTFEHDDPFALWMGSSSGLLHMYGAAK